MPSTLKKRMALSLYDWGWKAALPVLKWNSRLTQGFSKRTLDHYLPPKSDLWIQAASAGEAYLAWEIIRKIKIGRELNILLTANTDQGMSILKKAVDDITPNSRGINCHTTYFPFDKPSIMREMASHVRPKVAVNLETELWPGQLWSLKEIGAKTLIINARMSSKSLARYLTSPSLWMDIRPDRILAVSDADQRRFKTLFGDDSTGLMNNIKFDRITTREPVPYTKNPLSAVLRPGASFLVLGSIRKQEEFQTMRLINRIRKLRPKTVIGLFPRHMERIKSWRKKLELSGLPFEMRSETQTQVSPGTIVLWDTFGELNLAYQLAKAAFVGGSLAPLGGQNFLEPLTCGVIPVTGPSWENFRWVGQEIFDTGLVRIAKDEHEAAELLADTMKRPQKPEKVMEMLTGYVQEHEGGVDQAVELITQEILK